MHKRRAHYHKLYLKKKITYRDILKSHRYFNDTHKGQHSAYEVSCRFPKLRRR
jgi:hypothetical protein